MRKLFLCIVLIILICNFCIISFADNNTISNTSGNTVTDLQDEHKELRNQIINANTELENVQNELSDNLQKVQPHIGYKYLQK